MPCTTCTKFDKLRAFHYNFGKIIGKLLEEEREKKHKVLFVTYGSSSMNPEVPISETKSKSYEQFQMDISLCSYLMAPDAMAHCAFKLIQDMAATPTIPPNSAFWQLKCKICMESSICLTSLVNLYRCIDPGHQNANGENAQQRPICDGFQAHGQLQHGAHSLNDNDQRQANRSHANNHRTHNPIDGQI